METAMGSTMVRKIYVLIITCCLMTILMLLARPFAAHGRGCGSYAPEGPFQMVTGEFKYNYTRYGAIGKDWESDCTSQMPHAAVNAYAQSSTGGSGNCPSVRFGVWFLGPMQSDHPKCTFEIVGGGRVENILRATRYSVDVIATPEMTCNTQAHDSSISKPDALWTVRFHCTSE